MIIENGGILTRSPGRRAVRIQFGVRRPLDVRRHGLDDRLRLPTFWSATIEGRRVAEGNRDQAFVSFAENTC